MENNIKEKETNSNFDNGFVSYISNEDELKKSYELQNNINTLVDDFAEKIAKEDKSKNKSGIKKDLSNKIIDFIDCASKFGVVNYASSLLVFSILKTCCSNINTIINKFNQVKQNLSELDLACSNTATELVKFSNFNKDNELKLAQLKENPIKYNFESDKILRLYKEEIISSNDSRFDLIKAKVQSIAKNISANNIELNNKIEKILMKTAMNILNKKVIEKGYDIIPPNSNYIVNGDLKNSKDKTIIKETESLYKTRIKFLEDNGIIKENSIENEEELELINNSN